MISSDDKVAVVVSWETLLKQSLVYKPTFDTFSNKAHKVPNINTKHTMLLNRTSLPSNNAAETLNRMIATLHKHGCNNITRLLESALRQFVDGHAIATLLFVYLVALCWIMQRLQRSQLREGGNSKASNNE